MQLSCRLLACAISAWVALPATATNDNSNMETVTVTATRSNASLGDVAGNISVITQDTLATVSHEHIQQAMVRVPGAWVSRGNGQEHLTAIRSPVLTGAGSCGAFVFAEDGIPLRAPGFCNVNMLFDVNTEQAGAIEVIRGPASTLYGSNAVHGVINVRSVDPFTFASAQIGLESGPHDYLRTRFGWSHKNQHSALAIYGNLTSDGGFKDDSGFDQQKFNVVHAYDNHNLRVNTVFSATNLNQETAGFIQGFESYRDANLRRTNPNPEAYRDSQSARLHSRISYTTGNGNAFSVTPYLRWTDMTFLQHYVPWQPVEHTGHSSMGFQSQFVSHYDNATVMTGFDVDVTRGELQEIQDQPFSPTLPEGVHYDYRVTSQVYSPFLQASYAVSQDWRWDMGVRYEVTRYDYDNRTGDGDACAEGVQGCRFSRPSDREVDFREWSFQLGTQWDIFSDAIAYAKASRGYRAPQTTELFRLQSGQRVSDLDAETMDAIEIGMRGQWQQLFYDVTAFSMEKDEVIIQDTQRQFINGGRTRHEGIEMQLSYRWDNGLYASATGTLASHRYANDLTISRESVNGNEIDTAPRHLASVQLGYQYKHLNAELEWSHVGDYYLNPENTATYEGHQLVNLRASMALSGSLTLAVRLLNVLDEEYAERADFAFGNFRYFVGEPRSVFVSARYQLQ